MCSVEEEPALGRPGAASQRKTQHRDLQLVLPPEGACGTPSLFAQVQYLGE